MHKKMYFYAALFGAAAVGFGAFGAHSIQAYVTAKYIEVYKTGVQYHFYHTIMLALCGVWYKTYRHAYIKIAAYSFMAGILLFSGSLYALAILSISNTQVNWLGAVTPFGGVCFIAGWLCIAIYFSKNRVVLYKKKEQRTTESTAV